MVEVVTSAQMRAIEQAAIESGAVTGAELMERAGQAVVQAILAEWPALQRSTAQAVVLCGPGNNGGDGYVIARVLAEMGWDVQVFHHGDPARMPPDAKVMRLAWEHRGKVTELGTAAVPRWFWDYDPPPFSGQACGLVVDAIFGIGANRYPVSVYRLLQRYCPPDRHWKVVAVDTPSTLDAATGLAFDPGPGIAGHSAFAADLTVTFHAPKPGHLHADGPRLCGRLVVADIGLGPWDKARHVA